MELLGARVGQGDQGPIGWGIGSGVLQSTEKRSDRHQSTGYDKHAGERTIASATVRFKVDRIRRERT